MGSESSSEPGRVRRVAAGVEDSAAAPAARDRRHIALEVLVGRWINDGHTVATPQAPSQPIRTSDTYELAPGGFFIVHSAFGAIGDTPVGGVEIIGVDGDAYFSTFYDSFGNRHDSRLTFDGDVLRWLAERTRSTVRLLDEGRTQECLHEASADGVNWQPTMEVTLRKVA